MATPIVPAPDFGNTTVITSAQISGILSAYGLKGLLDMVYIRIGNEVMADNLAKLEGALSATNGSLTALTNLQNLQNQIGVGVKSSIPFTFGASVQTITYTTANILTITSAQLLGVSVTYTKNGTVIGVSSRTIDDINSYISGYNLVASAYYQPINPYFAVTVPGASSAVAITALTSAGLTPAMLSAYNYFRSNILSSKVVISGLISSLTPITSSTDPTTLLAKLKIVYSHLPSDNFSSMRAWALDSYTAHGSSSIVKQGALQQEVTDAITSGESLNNSQEAAVRNYMFIFQEYYTSASSVLQSLNQAITDIGRKLSGG